jgi:DNA polymerase-3 subunit epsilon
MLNKIKTIISFSDIQIEEIKNKIQLAEDDLSGIESKYSSIKRNIDSVKGVLFNILREYYEERDRLKLIIKYRNEFIDKHLKGNTVESEDVKKRYDEAKRQSEEDYESTAESFLDKTPLTPEQEQELKTLWKKLVKLYHPDLVHDDPEKSKTYHLLTQMINDAKSRGDIETLKKIADDPMSFVRDMGWSSVSFDEVADLKSLEKQLSDLLERIEQSYELLQKLYQSADYELLSLSQKNESFISSFAEKQKNEIKEDCIKLSSEADKLKDQIKILTGEEFPPIA